MTDARPQTRLDQKDDEKERPEAGAMVAQQLFESRTVLIFGEISQKVAKEVIAQLIALDAKSADPIRLIICSQGGHVEAGDTIHDMIRFIKAPVKMIGTGWVASAGAHIYLSAKKENRYCLPNTRFLLHQPMGGVGGPAADIAIEAKEIVKMRQRINEIIARETGQSVSKVEKDTDRNFWMSAEEAKEYGLVDEVLKPLPKPQQIILMILI